jgi:DNA-binding transcriptional MerR regulator
MVSTLGLSPDWAGTAAQLAQVLMDLLSRYALNPEPAPSERLVRFYVTSGVLQRPQREGREALFGVRQAIEFLAARALLEDGWPLAKVAEYLPEQSEEALLALIPERVPTRTRAQELVEKFQSRADRAAPAPSLQVQKPVVPEPKPEVLRKRQVIRESLRDLGQAPDGPIRETRVKVVLAPWCELFLHPAAMESLTPEQIESAVTVFRAVIEGETARKGRS